MHNKPDSATKEIAYSISTFFYARNNVFNLTKESIDILTQFLDDWELIQPPVLRFVQYQYFTDEEKELARIARINGKLEYKNNPNFDWKRTEKSDFPNYQSYYRIVE